MQQRFTLIINFALLWALFACGGGNKPGSDAISEDSSQVKSDSVEALNQDPKVEIDQMATIRAKIMAGVKIDDPLSYDSIIQSAATQSHYKEFNNQWAKLENSRLSKIRPWRDRELKSFNEESHNLFYPFSGPDFLNAYTFFPNCDNYLMFGLEPNGKLVDLDNMPPNYLASLRNALAEIFERNYFITSYMGGDLWGKGVLPIVNIFMARTGNQIVDMKRFYLDTEGKAQLFELEDEQTGKGKVEGIMIEFLNKDKTKSQRVYYFGTDVQDDKMKNKMELVKFIKSFPDKITFIKSASYILHNTDFSTMRNLVLEETSAVLQDDTGVRYSVFDELGWNVKLYGKYARPVADFGGYTYQPALQQAFNAQKDIPALDFTFGYHWKTDNTSLLLCTKPKAKAKKTEE